MLELQWARVTNSCRARTSLQRLSKQLEQETKAETDGDMEIYGSIPFTATGRPRHRTAVTE